VRRYFVKAEPNYPVAQEMIDLIAQLYVLEAGVDLDSKELASIRQEKSKPIVDEIQAWLLLQPALPKSSLGKAITYTSKLWSGLTRFLDDPRVPLDNNATERSIRGIASERSYCTPFSSMRKQRTLVLGRCVTWALAARGERLLDRVAA
jgi:transposase